MNRANYFKPKRICSAIGCDEIHHANGFCAIHNYHNKKHGNPLLGQFKGTIKTCSECPDKHWAKGFCFKHYGKYSYQRRCASKKNKVID